MVRSPWRSDFLIDIIIDPEHRKAPATAEARAESQYSAKRTPADAEKKPVPMATIIGCFRPTAATSATRAALTLQLSTRGGKKIIAAKVRSRWPDAQGALSPPKVCRALASWLVLSHFLTFRMPFSSLYFVL
jgi:hypothetical protein